MDAALATFLRDGGTGGTGGAGVPIEKGGSGRKFSRVPLTAGGTGVLCVFDNSRAENALYADIAVFLREQVKFPVPKVLVRRENGGCGDCNGTAVDAAAGGGALLMEDLGETDLLALRGAPPAVRRDAYRSALRAIRNLHDTGLARFREAGDAAPRLMTGFDAALYRWEQDYFWDNFQLAVNGEKTPLPADLRAELDALAARLLRLPAQLVHRDCQSQNILWRDGQAWFIDFQGMRVGTGFYDLASLLYDPYAILPASERKEFAEFYRTLPPAAPAAPAADGAPAAARTTELVEFTRILASPADFYRALSDAAAQRLMQALGAYGFLGILRGKTEFLAHIPAALDALCEVTAGNPQLPLLHAFANKSLLCCPPQGGGAPCVRMATQSASSPSVPPSSETVRVFRHVRRVGFSECDPAGIAHFARFPLWVEEAEAAFWRKCGVTVPDTAGGMMTGWPRVSFSIRYRAPVRYNEEVAVVLSVEVTSVRSLSWRFRIEREAAAGAGGGTVLCASGEMRVVHAAGDPLSGKLESREIPAPVLAALKAFWRGE